MTDLHSVDSLTRSIQTMNELTVEDLYLKKFSSPTPSEDQYENIPCILMRPQTSTRSVILYLHKGNLIDLVEASKVRDMVEQGFTVFGIDLTENDAIGQIVAEILKGVSYLTLRRDIVDHIYCWGNGKPGLWALLAAIFDERIASLVIEDVPMELKSRTGSILRTPELCTLVVPRRLALLNAQVSEDFERVMRMYKDKKNFLLLDAVVEPDLVMQVLRWLLGGQK